MNERTHFFIKNIPHTLYSRKGWCFLCVRSELETGTGCYILTQSSSSTIATLLSHLGWAAQPWVTEGPSPPSWAGSHSDILPPTGTDWLKPSVAPGYMIVSRPPASSGRTNLPPSPNSTMSTVQGDIPISSTGCICFAVLPLIYACASLDWRLGQGSIFNTTNYVLLTDIQRISVVSSP